MRRHDRWTRGAADFISRRRQTPVVCTKHLLRLELATPRCPRHQRGEQQHLRGLETHLCPPAGRLKATGSGRAPVPVSTQLGGGAAHSSSSPRRAIRGSSEHGSPINAQDSGTFVPRCSSRSGPHVDPKHPLGLGPMLGPVRRPALPCSSSAFSCPGLSSSRPRRHRSIDQCRGYRDSGPLYHSGQGNSCAARSHWRFSSAGIFGHPVESAQRPHAP